VDVDCDDGNEHCTTDCTDVDGDGWCPPQDCDDDVATCTDDCTTDVDGDGIPDCADECPTIPNVITATIELPGVDATKPLTRCIHFVPRGEFSCGEAIDVEVVFSGNPAVGVATIDNACNVWTDLCAKDAQHTLWDTAVLDPYYETVSAIVLEGGDTDNDGDVDINDVTWFIAQYGELAAAGGCPWDGTRDADFSNNGAVLAEDYTFLTSHWQFITSCDCPAELASIQRELARGTRVSVPTDELPREIALRADIRRDGRIDYRDVEEFERRNGLPNHLSSRIKKADRLSRSQQELNVRPARENRSTR
jgi:hypothetical protein